MNKSAWQNNPYSVRPWGAEHAVDGEKLNLSAEGGQCAISYGGQTAEWRVNLGRVYTIHHILIQFRTDNLVWGKFYFIFLTENTEIKKEINGQFKNKHYSKKKKNRRQAGFTAEPMFFHGVPYVFEGLRYFFINTRLICQFF